MPPFVVSSPSGARVACRASVASAMAMTVAPTTRMIVIDRMPSASAPNGDRADWCPLHPARNDAVAITVDDARENLFIAVRLDWQAGTRPAGIACLRLTMRERTGRLLYVAGSQLIR